MNIKRSIALTAVAVLYSTVASADAFSDSVVNQLTEQGYVEIEVKRGPSQLKVEAKKAGRERELVFDRETGAVLKDESEAYGGRVQEGVEYETEDRNFLDDDDDDDDDDDRDDDKDDDHDDDKDDDRDDDHDDDDDDSDDDDDDDDDDDSDDDDDDDDDDKS